MEINQQVHSDLAIPPGEYLEEVLAELALTKDELARRMGRPASKLSHIFNGTKRITEETALQLEKVVGVPAHIWTALEAEYRLTLERAREARALGSPDETKLVPRFCYKELAALGEVPNTRAVRERVNALQAYFGVTTLTLVTESQRYQVAFRCADARKASPEAIAAWLRFGERKAHRIETAPFDERSLRALLPELRPMTLIPFGESQAALQERLAACGVALVICPHFPKTYAHGATYRMGPKKAVLMTTLRGGWADVFWFSLFHELGHILLHGSRVLLESDHEDDAEECEANAFAADHLIPPEDWQPFRASGVFTVASIQEFAARLALHPGIVVGRLQHEGLLRWNRLNQLRMKLTPVP